MNDFDVANVSFGGDEAEFITDSPYVVLLSPPVLDSLADELGPLCARRCPDLKWVLGDFINRRAYGQIAMYEIPDFIPGRYRLDISQVRKVASRPPGSFLVDGPAMLAVDASKISLISRRLDWDTCQALLASRPDDSSIDREVVESMGGPFFAIVTADAELGLEFDGPGQYIMTPEALRRLE
ncbi:MAG: hypothetical protein HN350_07525 [Phycisphaerales bacterium]|jgi:hypothetical protein|nr:hypothetical protein [Phycisphaerales bacterium]